MIDVTSIKIMSSWHLISREESYSKAQDWPCPWSLSLPAVHQIEKLKLPKSEEIQLTRGKFQYVNDIKSLHSFIQNKKKRNKSLDFFTSYLPRKITLQLSLAPSVLFQLLWVVRKHFVYDLLDFRRICYLVLTEQMKPR